MSSITTSYQILGVSQNSTEHQLRSAYKRMAMMYHPDKLSTSPSQSHPSKQVTFITIQQAYQTILQDRKRKKDISAFKQYFSKKLIDLFESDTNDEDMMEDDYFRMQERRMEEKMETVKETLNRWRRSRERKEGPQRESPPRSGREERNQIQKKMGLFGLETKMDEINERIRRKINIFTVFQD